MEKKEPYWKHIKELFDAIKKKEVSNIEKVIPVLAIYSAEPVYIKENILKLSELGLYSNSYLYLVTIFSFKEEGKRFYQCHLKVDPTNSEESKNLEEENVYAEDEMIKVMSFVIAPDRMFETAGKRKKIMTFSSTELSLADFLNLIEAWKKEKTT